MSENTQIDQSTELHETVEKFVNLANELKNQGKPVEFVNAALMLASCTYTTYTMAGNEGYLKEAGVNKITATYRQNLANLQKAKKNQYNPDGKG